MSADKRDWKNQAKLSFELLNELRQVATFEPQRAEVLNARIMTEDLVVRIKASLGCVVVCVCLLFDWKTWHIPAPLDFTVHFPRLPALMLIEASLIQGFTRLRIHKHYKWAMQVVVTAATVALVRELDFGFISKFLYKSWLRIPIEFLWVISVPSFLFCMALLFMQMSVPKLYLLWFQATMLAIAFAVLFSFAVGVALLTTERVGYVLVLPALGVFFFFFGVTVINAVELTLFQKKWEQVDPSYLLAAVRRLRH